MLTAPHPNSVKAVQEWLCFHGIHQSSIVQETGAGDWITARVSAAQAERMLGTEYNIYHNPASSERVVRTLSYSLPRELTPHINVVAPTTYLGTIRSMRATHFAQPEIEAVSADAPSDCDRTITPSCLRNLYKTIDYVPSSTSTNQLGIAGYLNQYANRADLQVRNPIHLIPPDLNVLLQAFFGLFRSDASGSNFTTVLVNGGQDDQSEPGSEVSYMRNHP